jgi:single-stranded DNA-specific DHH superfamily exonuclease
MTIPSWTEHLVAGSSVLIIFHWDKDGVSSAALITQYLEKFGKFDIQYAVPEIGTYHIPRIRRKDFSIVFIVDYSVPEQDITGLLKLVNVPIVIYDHHLRDPIKVDNVYYYNPVAEGDSGMNWPSCTWVLKEMLDIEMSDIVLLGIAGDMEDRFIPGGFKRFPKIESYLDRGDRDYLDYVNAKDLIDIHYKANDRDAVSKMPLEILRLKGDPVKIMDQQDWCERQRSHFMELRGILIGKEPQEIVDKIGVYYINTDKDIISTVTRRLSAGTKDSYVMVINTGFFKDKAQIYVRQAGKNKESVEIFKNMAESLGAQAGGKEDVAGIIMDKDKVGQYIDRLKTYYA